MEARIYHECVRYYPFVLGAQPVRPVDLAAFYAAIANEGMRPEPYVIDSIERNGTKAVSKIRFLGDRIQDGKKAAVLKVKRAAKAVRAKAASVDKTIRAKPYQSLGIAAGAGLVAGYIISRKRKPS